MNGCALAFLTAFILIAAPLAAQSVLSGVDLKSPAMTEAKYTRADIVALIEVDMPIDLTRANLTNATLMDARTAGDFTRANLAGADFTRADFSADMTNQSMGLMRSILCKANAKGTNFTDANFMRADLEFADLADANLSGANMMGTTMAGTDLAGANVTNARFGEADVTSARLVALIGEGVAQFESAKNLNRAFRE